MSDDEVRRLREEVARLRSSLKVIEMARDNAFNDLYAVVTLQYGKWDEGETVDWRRVREVCKNMMEAFQMSASVFVSLEE